MSGLRSRRPPSRQLRRDAVLRARAKSERVLDELPAHHPPRRVRREAEALSERDARLQRVALGEPLVGHAAEVPRLVSENGDSPGALVRPHFALEGQPVEVEAALRRQVRELAPDGGNAVRVLDGADVLAGLVTSDRHRLPRDLRGFLGVARRRLGACVASRPFQPVRLSTNQKSSASAPIRPRPATRRRRAAHASALRLGLDDRDRLLLRPLASVVEQPSSSSSVSPE